MKKMLFTNLLLFATLSIMAQPTGYYNGTEGLTGDALKTSLHNIIKNHQAYTYSYAKYIIKEADQDPNNPANVILVYTGRSHDAMDYGTGGNYINREHVWAKSHGDFGTETNTGSDVHNLKPADASVNEDRSNKDFDNGGQQHSEATECYFDSDSWEPRNAVKGDIARIIFYMATRYEGGNGEIDLEVVNAVNTSPDPEHGKLSTLLAWNMQDPPDDFERRRNNVIFKWQRNRNPFIDNPQLVNMIWAGAAANPVMIGNLAQNPDRPSPTDAVTISAAISSNAGNINTATLTWGTSFGNLSNTLTMSASGNNYTATIPANVAETKVFYKIDATDGTNTNSVRGEYIVKAVFTGTLTAIGDVQGYTNQSPLLNQTVSIAGVVTASFGTDYYLQSGSGAWKGVVVYDPGRNPQIGDSVIVTGKVKEYYEKTEVADITAFYHISSGNLLPAPVIVPTSDVATGSPNAEQYEGVFVKVVNAICTSVDEGYGMWKVNDGTGACFIHNTSIYAFTPTLTVPYNITGVLNYDFSNFKIDIRIEDDVTSGTDMVAPEVSEVLALTGTEISVKFTEEVEEISGLNATNYQINNNITVTSARYFNTFTKYKVVLTVEGLSVGNHSLTVNNVKDLSGNTIVPESFDFTSNFSLSEQFDAESFSIYPNPLKNNSKLSVSALSEIKTISVFDLSGKNVLNRNFDFQKNAELQITNLKAGFYFIKVETTNGWAVQKISIN